MKDFGDRSAMELTKLRLLEGVWEGLLTGAGDTTPNIVATHLDQPLADVSLRQRDDGWLVRVPLPAEAISDGVHTVLILDASSDTVLNRFSVIAGEALGDDLLAEVDLLRAELDMLKRAFRRHCTETDG